MAKEIKVATVKQAKCATALFVLDEMSKDLLELGCNLQLYCEGTTRVDDEQDHRFTYATAQVKAKRVLERAEFVATFLEDIDR